MSVGPERRERYKAILAQGGIPMPPGEELRHVRWQAGSADWYAQTELGWFWLDVRPNAKEWKPTLFGPQ